MNLMENAAVLLGSRQVAATLADAYPPSQWAQLEYDQVKDIAGMTKQRYQRLQAGIELARVLATVVSSPRPLLDSPAAVAERMASYFLGLQREHFMALLLNTKNRLLAVELISIGSLNAAVVSAPQIFRTAIRHHAAGIILCHHHASGDYYPSPEDIGLTKKLIDAGRLMGIPVLDHVVIGTGTGYISLRDEYGLWDKQPQVLRQIAER
jgi:DNA repair protein RadC